MVHTYFAYGANVNTSYLENRYNIKIPKSCKSIGILFGYSFYLTYSYIIDSVIASVKKDNNGLVFGVLYKFDTNMMYNLNKQEFVDKNVYSLNDIKIFDLDNKNIVPSKIYILNDTKQYFYDAPNLNIYKHVIINGLINNNIPPWYIYYIKNTFDIYEKKCSIINNV